MRLNEPLLTTPQSHQRGVDLTLLLATIGSVVAGVGVELALEARGGGLAIGVASALTFGLLYLLIPRRYEVFADRMAVVFVWRRWEIPYETIESVRAAAQLYAYAYIGVRFATAPSQSVEVRRVRSSLLRRPNLIISPQGRDEFVRVLQQALEAYRAGGG